MIAPFGTRPACRHTLLSGLGIAFAEKPDHDRRACATA
jgi:hypothetical protein